MAKYSINIPSKELPKIAQIMGLSAEVFDSLLAALRVSKPTITPTKFSEGLSKKVLGMDASSILPMLETIFALYWMKESNHLSAEQMAEAISEAATNSNPPNNRFPVEKRDLLHGRLKALLNFDSTLGVTAKALDVLTEHQHIFCGARIISDIRPIFAGDAKSTSAAVIVHNLQIGFHQQGDHKEFYVALDASDLKNLRMVIARAETKAIALEYILAKAEIESLEI